MQLKHQKRLFKALSRQGLDVRVDGPILSVCARQAHGPRAQVLLPAGFPVEGKALRQLANLASARHPLGGEVVQAYATPDFHPGDAGVAIGSVVKTRGMVIPAAVGSDINCGMRLHVADLPVHRFLAQRDAFVRAMTGDYLLGSRDVRMSAHASVAMIRHGLPGFLDAVSARPLGVMARADLGQLMREVDRTLYGGSLDGHERWVPQDLVPTSGVVRDGGLATIGGGNHFVEVQFVHEVVDRRRAFHLGVKQGQLAFMIHSGSRNVGKHVGAMWRDRVKRLWPATEPYPPGALFPLSERSNPKEVERYLQAEASAANYAFVNRALLAELLRARLRELFGDVQAPLVYDLPHNLTAREGDGWVTRKGACPAHEEQPVIIPGSMGTSSWLAVGCGHQGHLCSASHGAGRARSRFDMGRAGSDQREHVLGLRGVDCITLRPERRVEEAPAAYKPIQPVVDVQQAQGVLHKVAELRPVLTFKA